MYVHGHSERLSNVYNYHGILVKTNQLSSCQIRGINKYFLFSLVATTKMKIMVVL